MEDHGFHYEPSIQDLVILLRETLEKEDAIEFPPSAELSLPDLKRYIVLAIAELSVADDEIWLRNR